MMEIRGHSREAKQEVKRMDKLFWSVWKSILKKDTITLGTTTFKMDTGQV